jgi:hypothetical protein
MTAWILLAVAARLQEPSADADDSFIRGYATAILEREFSLRTAGVEVRGGILTMRESDLGETPREKVRAVLARIPGVKEIRFIPAAPGDSGPPPRPQPVRSMGGGWSLFPEERLFQPLIADPRWPHFSLSYEYFRQSEFPKLQNVGAISLGETFECVGYESRSSGSVALGVQPAIFAIFNLDALSHDLVNADYRIAIPLDYRIGWFSAEARVMHQSSHLGDEFLLDTPTQRINLSYEAAELLASFEPGKVRFYAGAAEIFHSEPDLKPWSAQAGVELKLPAFLGDAVSPLVAVDVKVRQETEWNPDLCFRAGVEFTSPEKQLRRVQLLLEYFRGRNPNGQFFNERVEYLGVGLHVHF